MKEYGPAEVVKRLGEWGFPMTTAGLKKLEEIILGDSKRKKGSRRRYSEDDLCRFRIICCFRALGFSRAEIRKFLSYEALINTKVEKLQGLQSKAAKWEQEQEITTALLELYAQTKQASERVRAIEESMSELITYLGKIHDKYWNVKSIASKALIELLMKSRH